MCSEAPDAERALIERAQQGDRAALRTLYQRHAPDLFRATILPIVHDRAIAQDLLADTFVRAMEKLDRYHWQGKSLRPWLARIAKNLCFDHLRHARRVASWSDAYEPVADLDLELLVERAEQVEGARAQVDACIAELSPRYREAITLRLVEQRSRSEAAELLGLTVGTLDVLLCRACKAFRKHWEARYGSRENAGPIPRTRLGQRSTC